MAWTPIPGVAQAYVNDNGWIVRFEAGPGWIFYHEEIEDEFLDSFIVLNDLLNNPGVSFAGTDPMTGKLPTDILPALAITDVFPVADQAAMLALSAQKGDVAVRLDSGQTYILSGDNPAVLAQWIEVTVQNPHWSQIQGKPTEFPPSAHGHAIGNVTGLQAELDSKAAVSHPHVIGDVTGLQDALNAKAAAIHNHDGAYAPVVHDHAIEDVTGLQDALNAKAATIHNHDGAYATVVHDHAIGNVTALQATLDDLQAQINTSNGVFLDRVTGTVTMSGTTVNLPLPPGVWDVTVTHPTSGSSRIYIEQSSSCAVSTSGATGTWNYVLYKVA